MSRWVPNIILDTFAKTLVVYACIHGITMGIYTIMTGRYEVLNGFTILGISLFFPEFGVGIGNFWIGGTLLFLIGVCVYLISRRKDIS